MYMVS